MLVWLKPVFLDLAGSLPVHRLAAAKHFCFRLGWRQSLAERKRQVSEPTTDAYAGLAVGQPGKVPDISRIGQMSDVPRIVRHMANYLSLPHLCAYGANGCHEKATHTFRSEAGSLGRLFYLVKANKCQLELSNGSAPRGATE